MVRELFRKRAKPKEIPQGPEPLVFIEPGGGVPSVIYDKEQKQELPQSLRDNPETSAVMETIENGPNATLYKNIVRRIKDAGPEDEKGEYLVQAATALFFGNTITDASIEGIISSGGDAVRWRNVFGYDLWDGLSVPSTPADVLLKERVDEVLQDVFVLPQNEEELKRNVELQIARIGRQIIGGKLERKAQTIGVDPEVGKRVGEEMVKALQEVKDYFVPGVEKEKTL